MKKRGIQIGKISITLMCDYIFDLLQNMELRLYYCFTKNESAYFGNYEKRKLKWIIILK